MICLASSIQYGHDFDRQTDITADVKRVVYAVQTSRDRIVRVMHTRRAVKITNGSCFVDQI